jgi:hypothetical protein
MAHKPVGIGSSFSLSVGAATTSQPISVYTDSLRVVSTGNAFIKVDSEPTATPSDYYVTSNNDFVLAISPASSRVSGITTGATTIIDFPQGTGSPFEVGDYVTLTSPSQAYHNFTHKRVSQVLSTSGFDGLFSRRIIIENNSSGIATAYNGQDADLRRSLKVSAYGSSAGTVYYQQVQISSHA